jgi:hypothetical protein
MELGGRRNSVAEYPRAVLLERAQPRNATIRAELWLSARCLQVVGSDFATPGRSFS